MEYPLLTVFDASKLLGLSPGMVRYLERSGRLSADRTEGGIRLFKRQDIELLAAERSKHKETSPNKKRKPPAIG